MTANLTPEHEKAERRYRRFDGQQVHKNEVLQDKDVLEIHE
jgi:ribosome-interacting GTPase 1